ncbi:MAG: hypothetical protein VZS44_02930 [Bacilli bacterium]|nr:hypothetical protein [Bacilli bacterium]
MRIGIDLDNTICSTNEKVMEFENEFIKKHKITVDKLWSNNNYVDIFLNEYLEMIYTEVEPKTNAVSFINKLKEQGNEIYIITARTNSHVTDMHNIINNYCHKHKLQIDGIFIDAKDKVDICKKNNIDLMIDDSFYNYDQLTSNNIDTILFDEYNKHPYIKRRVLSWNEINSKIEKKS